MIKKIKCTFGYHNWSYYSEDVQLSQIAIFSPMTDTLKIRFCNSCYKKQELKEYLEYDTLNPPWKTTNQLSDQEKRIKNLNILLGRG